MLYPFERYLVWLIARGFDDEALRRQLVTHGLYWRKDFDDELKALRAETAQRGGAALARRKPQDKRPWSKSLARRLLGEGVADLADEALRARTEVILSVRPLRQAVELLTLCGDPPETVALEVSTRYGATLDVSVLQCYLDYFWSVSPDQFGLVWSLVEDWPEGEERDLYRSCLGRDRRFVFWRLGINQAARTLEDSEGEALAIFLQGAQQHLINAVDPMLNPSGAAPTAWVNNYAVVREMLLDWQQRNAQVGSSGFVDHVRRHLQLTSEKKELPRIGEGEFKDFK